MRQVLAYKILKTVENYKIVSTKRGRSRLRKWSFTRNYMCCMIKGLTAGKT